MQKDIIEKIRDKGGDFLVELKANQRALRYGVEDRIKGHPPRFTYTEGPELGHGRIETRTYSFNHSIMILSDMPQTKKGSWFLHYREKMDAELIATIEGTVYEIWRVRERIKDMRDKRQPIPAYLKGHLRRLDRQLNQMRSVAVYYREYSSIENLQLLGENYIKQMKRDLTPLTFQTSILCRRIGIAKDGFYSSMREGHKYDANNNEYLDSLGLDVAVRHPDILETMTSQADGDVDPNAPICIGMDYNANINWIVAGQPKGHRLNVIKSFYVKFERKIPALVEDFCRYYASHRNKTVVYYYDATALGSNYAVNEQDFHYVVCHEFELHGWRVESVYLGNPMRHDESTCSSIRSSQESNALCRSSTAPTMKTLSSTYSLPVSAMGATASAKINPAKSSPKVRKTCSNTAPTAPTLSIPSTSAARSSHTTIASPYQ